MATINTIESESIQTGTALAPPIATIDAWPSLDPTVPFSLQSTGITNINGALLAQGLFGGLGLQSITGLSNLLGFKTGVGGQLNVEPTQDNVTPTSNSSSPNGNLWGPWKKNGSSICVAPCSDQTAKKNVEPLINSLEKVLNLRGVSFDWDETVVPQRAKEEDRQIGLIAQEVEEIIPEVVRNETIESQTLKSIKYENLVALLIEGMKEQQEQINSLKETIQELSTKLAECCS
jgi:hypothetical protein